MASFDSHCFCARCREKGKGSDSCISHLDCNACNSLTEEQRIQLSTPSYRIKKEKRDSKKVSDTPKQDSSSSLIDPSVVTVVGAVDDQGIVKSPGSSSDKKKKQNTDKPKAQSSKDSKADKPSSSAPTRRQSTSSMDTDSDTDIFDRPPVDLFVEEGELSDQDLEASAAGPDLTLSEEQNYRETMSGIRSFMGWSYIPEMDTTASRSEDNPFAGPKTQPTGKISVSMPTDEWLCSKMGKLNITLTEGYPSRSSEAGGLLKDQFVHPPRSQAKWYSFVPNQPSGEQDPKTVHTWNTDSSKVNSTYSRIAKAAGIASTAPPSRQISQDNLRRWEKSAREASITCNQAAAFNRCIYKVQDNMQTQLKVVKSELSKGKSSEKVSQAASELQFLLNFNASITQAMAKTLEHLTDFVFVTVANTTLIRRDSYLSHLKMGIKPDTLAALRTGPLHIATLRSDTVETSGTGHCQFRE